MLASVLREDEIGFLTGLAFISGFSVISALVLHSSAVLDQKVEPSLLGLLFLTLISNTLAMLLGIGTSNLVGGVGSLFLVILLVLGIRLVFDTLCVIAAGRSETQRISTGAAIGAAFLNLFWVLAAIIAAGLLF
ncbi:hypothetical protein [Actibacterium sp. 188UL27-1]|uniref:hypothetical protein n=1 Tax=Actibacterium sp. 188UL27-1 TaxID=2786961 RepID=UPI0019582EE2|nr:hypothetical protein [Actibacterium sp. 188UL27-1]MBM7068020.1 hypothetical protein [Actibacterium sp. 188UL27-1]